MVRAFDVLPLRLRRLGYRAVGWWGTNPSFDNQRYWENQWLDRVRSPERVGQFLLVQPWADDIIMDEPIAEVTAHDRDYPDQPLFAYVSNRGTHEPNTLNGKTGLPAATIATVNAIEDDRVRYRQVLANYDQPLGRVLEFLETRANDRPRLIVVTGDHRDIAGDMVPAEMNDLPHNASEWTNAVIHGPTELLGPLPRVETFPSSHVDIMPKLLDIVGDRGPTQSMGTSLLADIPPEQCRAIVANGRGYRLDRSGWSLIVMRDYPDAIWTKPTWSPITDLRPGVVGSPFLVSDARRLREDFDT